MSADDARHIRFRVALANRGGAQVPIVSSRRHPTSRHFRWRIAAAVPFDEGGMNMDSWPATAMRMFFDEERPLLEVFAALQPLGVTAAAIVGEIKAQLTARCANRGELIAMHLKGFMIEIDHEVTVTTSSSPDVRKYTLQRRVEFVNLLKAALEHAYV
jgi:hypothetical protein